jgi:hypothetical protein
VPSTNSVMTSMSVVSTKSKCCKLVGSVLSMCFAVDEH